MKMGRNWEAMILFRRARYAFFVSLCARWSSVPEIGWDKRALIWALNGPINSSKTSYISFYKSCTSWTDVDQRNKTKNKHTWSLWISKPIKFIKSTNSEGSKCASRLLIKGGIECVTVEPAVAKILANAKRVCKETIILRSYQIYNIHQHTASRIGLKTFIAFKQTRIARVISTKTSIRRVIPFWGTVVLVG